MRRIAFFEDSVADHFRPLTLLRPVFELRCGHFSTRERVVTGLGCSEWGAFLRPQLQDVYREEFPQARINEETWLGAAPTLLINGRWLPDMASLVNLSANQAIACDGAIVAVVVNPDEARLLGPTPDWNELLNRLAGKRSIVETTGGLLEYPWQLVEHNPDRLIGDFRQRRHGASKADLSSQVAVLGRDQDVFIDPSAQIDPFVVIDARTGPIWIDAGVRLQPFTRLEGPCFIGRDSQLFRANIRAGTSIGPVCRVGGEVEGSIIHGYANKYHEGFLGHSYICPWVNIGALSTNSDLKNDYSTVHVPLWGESIDTGSTKVGCFIGDHAKAAICSLFNTGSSIGVMSMILPAGELLPKHLPSFTRYWHGRLEEFASLDGPLETARRAMARRKCVLTPTMERLLLSVFERTMDERTAAFDRVAVRGGHFTTR